MSALSGARPSQKACPVVVIGSSAGGVEALTQFVSDLPDDFPAPIVVVQHLAAGFRSHMAELLARCTPLRVKQAEEGDPLDAGTIYIAPPDRHVLITAERSLTLSEADKLNFHRPSVDKLFLSAACHIGPAAIAVVLSGTGNDGTAGSRMVKEAGGTVVAQDEATASYFGMPDAAIRSGQVDIVLPVSDIARALVTIVHRRIAHCDPSSEPGRSVGTDRS